MVSPNCFSQRVDRGLIYHLRRAPSIAPSGRTRIGTAERRSAALIARKIMVLDYVLSHGDLDWLSTERGKVDLFAARYGVPTSDLPQRVFAAVSSTASSTTRYFLHKLPVAVMGDPRVAYFLCLVTDTTGRGLEQFLKDHGRLFAWLPAWTVVAIGPSPTGLLACESAFQRYVRQTTSTVPASRDDLTWFFNTRHAVDRGDLAGLAVAALDRFRTLREAFRRPVFEWLYLEWLRHGDVALSNDAASTRPPSVRSVGTLVTELLPFDYSQFGSLPGVA